jgi:hypothetical protein
MALAPLDRWAYGVSMISLEEINAINTRKQEIADAIAALQAEDAELDIALKVLARFGGLFPPKTAAGSGSDPPKPKLGPPRPEGTPSLFDMTVEVLREAIVSGKHGLKGKEIVAEIGRKYWPGVQPDQVLPPIYGFVSKKRLKKNTDGIFKPVD